MTKRIDAARRTLEKDPNDVQALIELGNDYYDAEDYTRAIEAYQKSLKLDPRNADVLTDMGVTYRKSADPEAGCGVFPKGASSGSQSCQGPFQPGGRAENGPQRPQGRARSSGGLSEKGAGSIQGGHGQAVGGAASKGDRANEIGAKYLTWAERPIRLP